MQVCNLLISIPKVFDWCFCFLISFQMQSIHYAKSNLTHKNIYQCKIMVESFQDCSSIQDFEADFLWKVSLKILN